MENKTAMRHHLTPVRMIDLSSIISKGQVIVRTSRKGNSHALLKRVQTDAATVENSMEVPQKIKNGTAL